MDHLPLHLKYRPKEFDEVVGNESVVESLKVIVSREKGQIRSFLLTGPSGCGKTTLARIIANKLGCSDRDFSEYNSANVRGIDTIREIVTNSAYAPMNGKVKVYLLDEFHKATNDAQNAILKLLEDTPQHVVFILCTTDPEKLLKTIKTRCSTFQVNSLPRVKILSLLKKVSQDEGVDTSIEVLKKIADVCQGSPRQALVLLDQVIDIEDEEIAIQAVIDNTVDEIKVLDLCRLLMKSRKTWKEVADHIRALEGTEPENIRYAVLGYLSSVLLNKEDERVLNMIEIFSPSWMYSGRAGLTSSCFMAYKIFS
jgi:DNA polymerase III subunit gamma/tau